MDKIIITNKNDLNSIHKCENQKYEYFKYLPAKSNIDNQCSVKFYDIPPKKSNYPYHYHCSDVEIFYIISGNGELETEDGTKSIHSGDLIICPPGKLSAHKITNVSDALTLSYIEFDTTHHPEIIKYPHSNKIGLMDVDKENIFFNEDTNTDYYDGE